MVVRQCPQCGASVSAEERDLSATCAFCDSNLVVSQAQQEPIDQVVVFEVGKDRAVSALRSYLQEHWLAPERLRKATRPSEIRAVYVPFYCYDAVARTHFDCSVGIQYTKTETVRDAEGRAQIRTTNETAWTGLRGAHGKVWMNHLVSASKGLPNSEANQLEPYDLGLAKPFVPALTAGIEAELPTVPHEKASSTARVELEQAERSAIVRNFLPGDTVRQLHTDSRFDIREVSLVLLPVWIAAVRGPNGPMRLLVNGQTGDVIGQVPNSPVKVGGLVAAALAFITFLLLSVWCMNGGHGLLL